MDSEVYCQNLSKIKVNRKLFNNGSRTYIRIEGTKTSFISNIYQ